MARFSFNIWLFTTIKNSPMTKIFPKLGSKVCQSLNEPLKVDQNITKIAKLDKFRQIWSHWRRPWTIDYGTKQIPKERQKRPKNCQTLEQVVLGVLVRIIRSSDDVERASPGQHLVKQDAEGPPVDGEWVVFTAEDLRRDVVRSSWNRKKSKFNFNSTSRGKAYFNRWAI